MSKSLYTTIIEETAPTTTTVGVVGQLYLDSSTKILYQCVAINIEDLTYEWKQIGGGVSQEDYNKLVNNEIQITDTEGGFSAGNVNRHYLGTVTIGNGAKTGQFGTSIGKYAYADNGFAGGWGTNASGYRAIAIGGSQSNNQINATARECIQFGSGTNSTPYTLQIWGDNIYNHNTHTLTVQNIELNSVDLGETLNEITPKVMRALITPLSAPSKTELIAVDSTNSQVMIEIGDGLSLSNGVLKATGSGVQASEFNKSTKTTFGDYIISKKVLVYNGGGSISDGATFTFDTAVSHPSVLELVLRNNGRNSNEYIKILSITPGGGTCSIHSFNSSDEMVIINFRFTSDTTMEIAGSIGLTDYDGWQLLKVYKVIE